MINVEGMVELENHDFASIIVKIGSSKNYKRIVNLGETYKGAYLKEKIVYSKKLISKKDKERQ